MGLKAAAYMLGRQTTSVNIIIVRTSRALSLSLGTDHRVDAGCEDKSNILDFLCLCRNHIIKTDKTTYPSKPNPPNFPRFPDFGKWR